MSLSVIIPTGDRSALLETAVQSVLHQSRHCDWVIVVDNGYNESTFPSRSNPRVRYLRTEPRIGPSMARNLGAAEAITEFIAFLDDDDIWEPDYIKYSIELLENGEADVVVGQLMRRGSGADSKEPYKMFPATVEQQREVFYRNPGFGGQNTMFRRRLFLAVGGFDQAMPASEDRDLLVKLMVHEARVLPQPLSVAVLCDHGGVRARHNQVRGNAIFLRKHWRRMRAHELFRASTILCKRWLRARFSRAT